MRIAKIPIVAMKEGNTGGAPSYTSGVQKWKGAADTLKPIDTSNNNTPEMNRGDTAALPTPRSSIKKVPFWLAPYKKAIPSNINPVEKAPMRKYFRDASLLFRLRLSAPVRI